ncbi:MAG TPA: YbhB/YbcL family Raf kinase inhibitor-like protein [Saprospiraceae bacterium]|nr:YbhB/YbcL family Raf kinase inhibitor-like protein [Saprospiraceae bacterium]
MKIVIIISLISFTFKSYTQTFSLKSNQLGGQATIDQLFDGFGCKGKNLSPDLYWVNPPKETKSFAVTIYDEDAPSGSGWWHWLIFNISPEINELKEGAGNISLGLSPIGSIQSLTDFASSGYSGPCPPVGSNYHRYVITVYALKKNKLDLDRNANPALVGYMLEQNVIEKASIIFYSKGQVP